MEAIELRPCPFCAHDKPITAAIGDDDLQFIVVTCPECGAIGPRATSEDAGRVETIELRPCPFCAHDAPTVATVGNEQLLFFVVTCGECGAIGPYAANDDPPGHAEHLWNPRFGLQ